MNQDWPTFDRALASRRRAIVENFVEFLRLESVSQAPAKVRVAGEWLAGALRARGLDGRVLEQTRLPSLAMLPPSARNVLAAQAAAAGAAEEMRVGRETAAVAATLRQAGWKVDIALRKGAPLHELLAATERARAQLLVVGARGHSVVERLLLGSVAEGALHRCPVSVLVTR